MVKRTYGQLKEYLKTVAGATGMAVGDPRVLFWTNLGQQELMNELDVPGVVFRYHIRFNQLTGELVLPPEADQMMQCTVDGIPEEIRSPWYEMVPYGPGPLYDALWNYDNGYEPGKPNRCWTGIAVDHGDTPVQYELPEEGGPWFLRVYGNVDEVVDGGNPVCNIRGLDEDGLVIRTLANGTGGDSGWVTGENVEIEDGTYHQTTEEFSKVTAFVKPRTNGYVTLKAWNGTTEIDVANYQFNETDCTYRKYYLPDIYRNSLTADQRIILARCRMRYREVVEDDDELVISNLPALQCMLQAQWKREAGNLEEYTLLKATAVDLIRKEAIAYRGKAKVPSLTFQRGAAIGLMPWVK